MSTHEFYPFYDGTACYACGVALTDMVEAMDYCHAHEQAVAA